MTRDDTKLLQAIIDGQKGLETRLTERIDKLEKKVDGHTERLDRIGGQLAYLEDDAPTIKEFNQRRRKVTRLEAVVYRTS